jgi:hypothetical protein
MRDAVDLTSKLRHPARVEGGVVTTDASSRGEPWRLDPARSVVDPDHSGSFPLNTEIEALLTFTNDGQADFNQPDAHALTIREHHSFVALPEAGFVAREQDPRVGFLEVSFEDFAQPYERPLMRHWIVRWRLEKADPGSRLSPPSKPLVFYLDQAIPEPIRSAIRRGALWWNVAFEEAGFNDAIRIADLPLGADPLDIRYPTIQWTNRADRGWSTGSSHVDPRTGEIIHAIVQLDSHRMRTVDRYWEATIGPGSEGVEPDWDAFAALDDLDPQTNEEQVMLNRIALLACHEMGHVLGLGHNFVASTYGRGSVMDYFAPRVRIRADGTADLSDAYMQGVGSYDRFAIAWGYGQALAPGTAQAEQQRRDELVKRSIEKGVVWGNYDDPRWNAYDDGPDPVTWLKQVLPVRAALLAHYDRRMLRRGDPSSTLAARFPLVYLFHRYALAAAINVIGGAKVPLSLAGDGQTPIEVWPEESQREALRLVLGALAPSQLEIPSRLWALLAPEENDRTEAERFHSTAGYLFSPEDGAREVARIVVGGLLNRERMQRLLAIAQADPHALSADAMLSLLVEAGWAEPAATDRQLAMAQVTETEIGERLMLLAADRAATPEVQALAFDAVHKFQSALRKQARPTPSLARLDHEITLFLENPEENTPHLPPSNAPPGPPI